MSLAGQVRVEVKLVSRRSPTFAVMCLIWVYYYGEVGIDTWEWLAGVVFLIILYIYFSRMKRLRLKHNPEYKHLLFGLYAKIVGAMAFSLIYFYYYKGGDTISYFYSSVSMAELAIADPVAFLKVLFGPNDTQHLQLFSEMKAQPLGYVFRDPRTFMVVRITALLTLICFKSYVLTAMILSSICYIGIWRCYQTFVSYFPQLIDKFAIGFFYLPSLVFWGSGIMKDTLTLTAACWWVHCFDEVFFKKDRLLFNTIGLTVSAMAMILLKPYVFMTLMPITFLWLLYSRVAKLRNGLIRVVALPVILMVMLGGAYGALSLLGDRLGKFGLEEALDTTVVIQSDMKRSEQYGYNYFDIGEFDGTAQGALKKAPIAINAALFRPYLWEARNFVSAISALENAWLLGLALVVVWRSRIWFFFRCIRRHPLIMACFTFTVIYGFVIGFTTPNFGALVRFKIMLLPFFVSCCYMVDFLNRERLWAKVRGFPFDPRDYLKGGFQAARY